MKPLKLIFCVLLGAGMLLAQSSAPNANSPDDRTNTSEQIKALQAAIAQQQKQIEQLQRKLEQEKNPTPQLVNATMNTGVNGDSAVAQSEAEKAKDSPLAFHIGGADFTPGGFLDFTSIFRTVNTGNLGTNFFNIPFNNTSNGQLTETRFTAQNSRISLKAADKFKGNDVTGYVEADFNGADPANVFVTSNSHTMRMRLYWLDLKHGPWEILGGQSWSWLTPNRVGLSPVPSDIFYTQNMDFNYQVGLTWTRAAQFRVAFHPNKNFAMGLALENPQQFIGQANMVILPAGFTGAPSNLAAQFDAGNNAATPNLHPDIIPKIAYDTDLGGKHFHVEAVGLVTSVKTTIQPLGTTTFVTNTKTGGGGSFNVNLEVLKGLRVIGNSFISDGGGRYIFGMGPQAVVRPDGTPSLVQSGSGVGGVEYQLTPKTMIYGYYGGAYFNRNFFADTSTGGAGKIIGFGGPGEANNTAQNRAIQEGTVGWIQTFWKSSQYGALQLITQASYLTRAPWFVAPGNPRNAHLTMGWADLRFTLP
jgi:hypothetical protein